MDDDAVARWIAPEVHRMGVSSTLKLSQLQDDASATEGGGAGAAAIAKLGFGRSPFPAPPCVVDCVRTHAACKEYAPAAGLPALRAVLAERYAARYHRASYCAEHVVVGPGSKQLLFLIQRALRTDLRVCVVAPAWVSYAPQCALTGHTLDVWSTSPDDEWRLTPERLRAYLGDDTETPRLLILNAPCNPTGAVYRRCHLRALAEILRTTNTIVVLDEIYADLHFGSEPHASLAEELPDRCIVTSGMSKAMAAGGYRLGYALFPPELALLCRATIALASETYSCAPSPMQYALCDVLRHHNTEVHDYQSRCRRILHALTTNVAERLRTFGVGCVTPGAAWYVLADFSSHHRALNDAADVNDGVQLCDALHRRAGVIVLHDPAFLSSRGHDGNQLAVRISLVDFDGERALENLPPITAPLDDAWLHAFCPRVLNGIHRIGRFVTSLDTPPHRP